MLQQNDSRSEIEDSHKGSPYLDSTNRLGLHSDLIPIFMSSDVFECICRVTRCCSWIYLVGGE